MLASPLITITFATMALAMATPPTVPSTEADINISPASGDGLERRCNMPGVTWACVSSPLSSQPCGILTMASVLQ